MLFQALDDKGKCAGYYADGTLVFEESPHQEAHTATWDYSVHLEGASVDYARLFCGGQSLTEVCPKDKLEKWNNLTKKLLAYFRSFETAKVCLDEHCFYKLVPERFLLEFFDAKNEITKHVLESYEKPKNYEFLVGLSEVVCDISQRKLNIDRNALSGSLASKRTRDFWKKIVRQNKISYNVFGTKTGRLTTKKNSFPILTLDSSFRSVINPTNDWLVELDFNAAELRTLLSLVGNAVQPQEDLHDWNIQNVFKQDMSREEAKKRIFAWLYNPNARDPELSKVYDRTRVVQKYFDRSNPEAERVVTIFDRAIPADEFHALNYIVQSTTSDLFLRRMVEVYKLLKGRKSFISFSVHDSLVIDMADDERWLLPEIVEAFSDTELGRYRVNVKAGKNYGKMQEIK